jgi:CHAD domain-containing protein
MLAVASVRGPLPHKATYGSRTAPLRRPRASGRGYRVGRAVPDRPLQGSADGWGVGRYNPLMDEVDSPPPADQLLALPVDEGCRRVALALLASTIAARVRLDDPDDRTALHDFRVALRRFRTWLRAYKPYLAGSVRKKDWRRLRDISRMAGVCRDNEVHVAWIRDVEESLKTRERPGGEWLLHQVAERQRDTDAGFRSMLDDKFGRTTESVGEDLAVYDRRIDLRDPVPSRKFAAAAAPLVLSQATALGDRLAAIETIQDQAVAHSARLAAKRLRYLLEPIAAGVEGAPALVKRLRHLQDTIGEMHDVHVMAEEVIEAAERAGAEQTRRVATALLEGEADPEAQREHARDPRPGLLAIATQLRRRGEAAFSELQTRWLGEHAPDLTDSARAIVARLTADPPAAPRAVAGDKPAEKPVETGADLRPGARASAPAAAPTPQHDRPKAPAPAAAHPAPPAAAHPTPHTAAHAAPPPAARSADTRPENSPRPAAAPSAPPRPGPQNVERPTG